MVALRPMGWAMSCTSRVEWPYNQAQNFRLLPPDCGSSNNQTGRDCGFVLLGFLLLTIAGSLAAEHALFTDSKEHRSSRYLEVMELFDVLHESKVALIAYSLSYADNYAPGGAGPGHFPCPDHDSPDDGNPRNDGPDPPCATQEQTIGRLPRITYTGGGRESTNALKMLEFYPLESMLDRQPWYAVSSGFINNPGNRVVNPGSTGNLFTEAGDDIVAIVIEPGAEISETSQHRPGTDVTDYLEGINSQSGFYYRRSYSDQSNDLLLPLRRDEISPLLKRRVAGFVVHWLQELAIRNCPFLVFPNSGVFSRQHDADVELPGLSGSAGCFPYATAEGSLECQDGLTSGGLPMVGGDCTDSIAVGGVLEGVQLARHWFIRNRWLDYTHYSVHESCALPTGETCVFVVQDPDQTTGIEISVMPVSGGGE